MIFAQQVYDALLTSKKHFNWAIICLFFRFCPAANILTEFFFLLIIPLDPTSFCFLKSTEPNPTLVDQFGLMLMYVTDVRYGNKHRFSYDHATWVHG